MKVRTMTDEVPNSTTGASVDCPSGRRATSPLCVFVDKRGKTFVAVEFVSSETRGYERNVIA